LQVREQVHELSHAIHAAQTEAHELSELVAHSKAIAGFYIPPRAVYTRKLGEVRALEGRLQMLLEAANAPPATRPPGGGPHAGSRDGARAASHPGGRYERRDGEGGAQRARAEAAAAAAAAEEAERLRRLNYEAEAVEEDEASPVCGLVEGEDDEVRHKRRSNCGPCHSRETRNRRSNCGPCHSRETCRC
jgi:hypothetical protein